MPTFQGKRVSAQWFVVLTEASRHVRFTLTSGQRTMAEQQALYNLYKSGRGNLAAFPSPTAPHIRVGRQDHAIDVNALDGGETRLQRWLEQQGARASNPVRGEAWHMEINPADLAMLAKRFGQASRLDKWRARRRRVLAAITQRERQSKASPGLRKLLGRLNRAIRKAKR